MDCNCNVFGRSLGSCQIFPLSMLNLLVVEMESLFILYLMLIPINQVFELFIQYQLPFLIRFRRMDLGETNLVVGIDDVGTILHWPLLEIYVDPGMQFQPTSVWKNPGILLV